MVQSMRSGVMVQPGEQLGCVGCHDHRLGKGKRAGHRTKGEQHEAGPGGGHGPAAAAAKEKGFLCLAGRRDETLDLMVRLGGRGSIRNGSDRQRGRNFDRPALDPVVAAS